MGHYTDYALALPAPCNCCHFPGCCGDDVSVPGVLHLTVTGVTYVFGTNQCDCVVGKTFALTFAGTNYYGVGCGLYWCGTLTTAAATCLDNPISVFLVCNDCTPGSESWACFLNVSTCNPAAASMQLGVSVDCGPPFSASTTGTNVGSVSAFCQGATGRIAAIAFTITV